MSRPLVAAPSYLPINYSPTVVMNNSQPLPYTTTNTTSALTQGNVPVSYSTLNVPALTHSSPYQALPAIPGTLPSPLSLNGGSNGQLASYAQPLPTGAPLPATFTPLHAGVSATTLTTLPTIKKSPSQRYSADARSRNSAYHHRERPVPHNRSPSSHRRGVQRGRSDADAPSTASPVEKKKRRAVSSQRAHHRTPSTHIPPTPSPPSAAAYQPHSQQQQQQRTSMLANIPPSHNLQMVQQAQLADKCVAVRW